MAFIQIIKMQLEVKRRRRGGGAKFRGRTCGCVVSLEREERKLPWFSNLFGLQWIIQFLRRIMVITKVILNKLVDSVIDRLSCN